jgi:hypothetical protein
VATALRRTLQRQQKIERCVKILKLGLFGLFENTFFGGSYQLTTSQTLSALAGRGGVRKRYKPGRIYR